MLDAPYMPLSTDDWSWVINRGRMPQALATKNGHSQAFALLNNEWDKLDLNSKRCSENQFADKAQLAG